MKEIKVYLNADKGGMWDTGHKLGLEGEALSKFQYALYEVECTLEVNMETGKTRLLNAVEV